jgi:acyl-CoA thioester hydrolase
MAGMPGADVGADKAQDKRWHDISRTVIMPALCDHYGHLNVRHYSALFNDAAWQMMPLSGVPLGTMKARGLGTVVATLTIDFLKEVTVGQLVLIRGVVTKVGSKSLAHELRLYETETMTHCATQKSVEVCFDMTARASTPFPDDLRAKLQSSVVAI